ncbi:MAG TPA: head decoration protein [Gemmatimonadaceae bacterium]|nr:head decoration protein [Gemmatimonadaceae bacterium]
MTNPAYDVTTSVAPRIPNDLSPAKSITTKVNLAAGAAIAQYAPMGRVTASGNWIESLPAAVDGSQTPRGILMHASAIRAGVVAGEVFTFGEFNAAAVVASGTWGAAALRSALFDNGIVLEDLL